MLFYLPHSKEVVQPVAVTRANERGASVAVLPARRLALVPGNLSSAPKEDMRQLDLIFITSTSGCEAQRFSPK